MPKRIPKIITEEEFINLMRKVKQNNHRLAFALGFYQCMRVSEIAGLREEISRCCDAKIKRFKQKEEPLSYICEKCGKSWPFTQLKRSKEAWKIAPLTKDKVDMKRNIIRIVSGKGQKDRNLPISPQIKRMLNKLPVGVTTRALEIAIINYSKEVLGKEVKFHELRKSGATHYLKKGWNVRQLQVFLGHSKLETTQIYTLVDVADLQKQMGWEE